MVAQVREALPESVQEAMQRPAELVQEYPMSSMVIVFGVGLGVGLLLSQMLANSLIEPEPTMTERWQRQLMGAADRVLPAAMSRQLHQYAA